MNVSVTVSEKLPKFLDVLRPEGRHALYSVGANALKIVVQNHLRREARIRHFSAARVGGVRTHHLEKGAARITFSADENSGTVHVPIVGISRAFHDVTIVPTHGTALTIPVAGPAYGHRVSELRRMGWTVFRPKGRDSLWGSDGKSEAIPLYALRKRVVQKQDRSLMPSDADMSSTVSRAMLTEIMRVMRKAS